MRSRMNGVKQRDEKNERDERDEMKEEIRLVIQTWKQSEKRCVKGNEI